MSCSFIHVYVYLKCMYDLLGGEIGSVESEMTQVV